MDKSHQAEQLWVQLHDLFDTDDGSLPDIEINNLTPQAIGDIYTFLRSRSELVGYNRHPETDRPCFWHKLRQCDEELDSVPNAALLTANGTAEAFHFVVGGLTFNGTIVPNLGVFIFSDSIALDYRMGEAWGSAQLWALFDCLHQIQQIAPFAEIVLSDGVQPEVQQHFLDALQHYNDKAAEGE